MHLPVYEALITEHVVSRQSVPFFMSVPEGAALPWLRSAFTGAGRPVRPPFDHIFVELQMADRRGGVEIIRQASGTYSCWFVDRTGELAADEITVTLDADGALQAIGPDDAHPPFLLTVFLAFACMAFCHVKNIVVDESPLSRITRRRLSRTFPESEAVRVRTLRIAPFSLTNDQRIRRGEQPAYIPFHLVRGHFATFSPEKPLFGRYSGTYWISAHARGNKGFGTVEHRYHIEPTEAA